MEPPSIKTPLSDQDILSLATNKSFSGSFSGAKNLQIFLWTDYHEHVPLSRLYNILRKSPDYLMNLRPVRRFPVRHYQIYSFGQLLELDLGFMKAYRKFKYILVVIDVFSWRIWAKAIVSKTAAVIRKNLGAILDSIDCEVTAITTDLGTEFIGNTKWFKERHILFRPKHYQKNKAAVAEHAVLEVCQFVFKLNTTYKNNY